MWIFILLYFKDIDELSYINLFLIFHGDLKEKYPVYSVCITGLSQESERLK